jgi:hypothetical protein
MDVSGQLHEPARFSREREAGTRWIGNWVGPSTGLHTVMKRKIPIPHRESNPDHPIVQLVPTELSRLLT